MTCIQILFSTLVNMNVQNDVHIEIYDINSNIFPHTGRGGRAAGLQSLDPCPELSNTSMLCTEGSSLIPLLEEPSLSEWKKAVFWQYPR